MANKSMYIPNDDTENYPSVDYNCLLKHLKTQLNEPTNQNSIKVHKVVKPTNKKTLGTNVPSLLSENNFQTKVMQS